MSVELFGTASIPEIAATLVMLSGLSLSLWMLGYWRSVEWALHELRAMDGITDGQLQQRMLAVRGHLRLKWLCVGGFGWFLLAGCVALASPPRMVNGAPSNLLPTMVWLGITGCGVALQVHMILSRREYDRIEHAAPLEQHP